jgi:hypothetical protein
MTHHEHVVNILETTRRNRQRGGADLWVTPLDVEVMAWFIGRHSTMVEALDQIEKVWEARRCGQLDIL